MISAIAEVITILLILVVVLIPAWRIVKRAGYRGWLALLLFVPFVNIVAIWLFAFSEWPGQNSGSRLRTGGLDSSNT